MTTKADGTSTCDRCGADIGNASLTQCAVISDLDPDRAGQIVNYHLCRTTADGEKGCVGRVLTAAALRAFEDSRAAEREANQTEPVTPPDPTAIAATPEEDTPNDPPQS